jgi:hypothetical protein
MEVRQSKNGLRGLRVFEGVQGGDKKMISQFCYYIFLGAIWVAGISGITAIFADIAGI